MKRSIYNIIEIIKKIYFAANEPSGKKKFQKLVYLIENLGGVDLGFKYDIHFYGPYSSGLDDVVTKLIGEGFLYYDYVGSSHLICLTEETSEYEAVKDEDFFVPDLSKAEYHRIEEVISKFSNRKPSELELLTTAHYVHSVLKDESEERIIAGVQKIKGQKYSETQIINAINELSIEGNHWAENPIV